MTEKKAPKKKSKKAPLPPFGCRFFCDGQEIEGVTQAVIYFVKNEKDNKVLVQGKRGEKAFTEAYYLVEALQGDGTLDVELRGI